MTNNRFEVSQSGQKIGKLTFVDSWAFKSSFESNQGCINFTGNGFFGTAVDIKRDDEARVGKIVPGIFGTSSLTLDNGLIFSFSTSFFKRGIKLSNERKEILLELKPPQLRNAVKGLILVTPHIDEIDSTLLIPAILYFNNFVTRRMLRTFLPISILLILGMIALLKIV